MDIQRLKDDLRSRLKAAGLNAKEASLKAGLGESTIRDILNGRVADPRVGTLEALAPVLGCTLLDLCAALDTVPVLGTEPARGSSSRAKGPARPRNRLGEFLVSRGVDGKELARKTGISARRLAAIADGGEATMAELGAIADALDLGVFDIFDFAPLTREEATLLIDLRTISREDRERVKDLIARLKPANDPQPQARKRKSA